MSAVASRNGRACAVVHSVRDKGDCYFHSVVVLLPFKVCCCKIRQQICMKASATVGDLILSASLTCRRVFKKGFA